MGTSSPLHQKTPSATLHIGRVRKYTGNVTGETGRVTASFVKHLPIKPERSKIKPVALGNLPVTENFTVVYCRLFRLVKREKGNKTVKTWLNFENGRE